MKIKKCKYYDAWTKRCHKRYVNEKCPYYYKENCPYYEELGSIKSIGGKNDNNN